MSCAAGDHAVHLAVSLPSARRRTASASCRSGSPRPGHRSRTGGRRPGRPGDRRASRGAAPPRRRRGRRRRTRAGPHRSVRIRHSRSSASSFSVTPGRIDGRSDASARSAIALAAATRSSSLGSLSCRSASTQPSIAHQLDVGRGLAQPLPGEVRDRHRLDRDPLHAGRGDEVRPELVELGVELVERRVRRLALDGDRVARVGDDPDVVEADEELARLAGPATSLSSNGSPVR